MPPSLFINLDATTANIASGMRIASITPASFMSPSFSEELPTAATTLTDGSVLAQLILGSSFDLSDGEEFVNPAL